MKIKLTFLTLLFCVFSFAQNEFITVWQPNITSGSGSGNYRIYFPGVGNNYTIYWEEVGNASHSSTMTNVTVQSGYIKTIDFGIGAAADAKYIIKVSNGSGSFSSIENGSDSQKLLEVKQLGNIRWATMHQAFYGCSNMDITAIDTPDLSLVTDLSAMFYSCKNLKGNSSFSLWDTSNIADMSSMFSGATNFNQDIGNWNTSNVTDMSAMFQNANTFNQNIGNWNTSTVTNMGGMFNSTSSNNFNQNIGNWDTSKVTDMDFMFSHCPDFNQNIGNWNTSNVTI